MSKWNRKHAYFKQEGDQINIGLGRGKALKLFNENITAWEVVRR
ncbi:hypothetical protein ACFWOY_32115 [Streptomyces sp. NPDC058423]